MNVLYRDRLGWLGRRSRKRLGGEGLLVTAEKRVGSSFASPCIMNAVDRDASPLSCGAVHCGGRVRCAHVVECVRTTVTVEDKSAFDVIFLAHGTALYALCCRTA